MEGGGFKRKPRDGKVEISYGTFKSYEGKGVGTEMCRQLVLMALKTDPSLKVTARTLPVNEVSKAVLKRNGLVCVGSVCDSQKPAIWRSLFNKKWKVSFL